MSIIARLIVFVKASTIRSQHMLTFGLIYVSILILRKQTLWGLELGKFCVEFSNLFFTFLKVKMNTFVKQVLTF